MHLMNDRTCKKNDIISFWYIYRENNTINEKRICSVLQIRAFSAALVTVARAQLPNLCNKVLLTPPSTLQVIQQQRYCALLVPPLQW